MYISRNSATGSHVVHLKKNLNGKFKKEEQKMSETERVDYTVAALSELSWQGEDARAITYAILALKEQVMISNQIALKTIGGGPINNIPGTWAREFLLTEYPDVAAALNIEPEDE